MSNYKFYSTPLDVEINITLYYKDFIKSRGFQNLEQILQPNTTILITLISRSNTYKITKKN